MTGSSRGRGKGPTRSAFGDVLIADPERLRQGHSLDDLSERRAGGDGGAATEGVTAHHPGRSHCKKAS